MLQQQLRYMFLQMPDHRQGVFTTKIMISKKTANKDEVQQTTCCREIGKPRHSEKQSTDNVETLKTRNHAFLHLLWDNLSGR